MTATLVEGLADQHTIVCLGPGGVGKTTTAAAVGAALSRNGSRVCVLTIDPARRLAGALGLDQVGNDPVSVPGFGDSFKVAMLDARITFDEMVRRYAVSEQQIQEITRNPVYWNLVTRLSGTQEYMAFERLWELRESGMFDTIVVDTPPAQAAIDFLHAPMRLAGFLDNRIFKFLLKPPPFYLRPLATATRSLIRQMAQVVGAQVIDDTIQFFQAFSGIEDGFRERAEATSTLLASSMTSYLLVTSARPDALAGSMRIAGLLAEIGHEVAAVAVNRLTPDFGDLPRSGVAGPASQLMEELAAEREQELAAVARHLAAGSLPGFFPLDDLGIEVASIGTLALMSDAIRSSVFVKLAG